MTTQQPQTTLRDLIQQAADERQLSGRALADLAQKQGFKLTHATVNAIRAHSYKSRPSEDTIRAIAWLAKVPERTAYQAAGRKVPNRPFADDLPPGVDTLEDRERKAAIAMLSALVAQQARIDETSGGKGEDSTGEHPGLSLVADPADTLAARKGRTQADIENEQADLWDGIDPPSPDDA